MNDADNTNNPSDRNSAHGGEARKTGGAVGSAVSEGGGYIPQDFIRELRERADIVEVVGAHVKLTRRGANYFGLCPFHNEKTPSFSVSPEKGIYHCFGCGANGNAISFVMAQNGGDWIAAVEMLARQLGMRVPRARGRREGAGADYGGVLRAALDHWQRCLSESAAAKDYLKRRGVSAQTIEKFGIGYARDDWQDLTRALPRYSAKELVAAGLQSEKNGRAFDYFRHRIIFPIFETNQRLCGFGGRALGADDAVKYLNSAESARFRKKQMLYGLPLAAVAAREKKRLIVCEGYMDVVALAQAGFGEAVATMGTAATAQQMRRAMRAAPNVVLAFDGDRAGLEGARRALRGILPVMKDGVSALFLFLPEGDDPDSVIRRGGAAGFEAMLGGDKALGLADFVLKTAADAGAAMSDSAGRATAMMKEGEGLIRLVNASQAPYLRDLLTRQLSERAGVGQQVVRRQTAAARVADARGMRLNERSPLFALLCCLEADAAAIAAVEEGLPLSGAPQEAGLVMEVLAQLRAGGEESGVSVVGHLGEMGYARAAQQVRRAASGGRYANAQDLRAELAQIIARLRGVHQQMIAKKALMDKMDKTQ